MARQNAVTVRPRSITQRSWQNFERVYNYDTVDGNPTQNMQPTHLRYLWRFTPDVVHDVQSEVGSYLSKVGQVFGDTMVLRVYTQFRIWMRMGINRVKAKLATLPLLLGNRGGPGPSNRSLVPRQNMTRTVMPQDLLALQTGTEANQLALSMGHEPVIDAVWDYSET